MKKKAFGLVELSIIIAISSFMIVSALSLYNINSKQKKSKLIKLKEKYETVNIGYLDNNARFDRIYDAIKLFVAKEYRLPCPDTKTSPDGEEQDQSNDCNGSTDLDPLPNTFIKYGKLPYKTLNLTEDFTKNQWGGDILYYVDTRFTLKSTSYAANSTDGFAMQKTMYDIDHSSGIKKSGDDLKIIKVTTDGLNQIAPSDGLSNDIRPDASYLFVLVSGKTSSDDAIVDKAKGFITNNHLLFFKNKQEILQDAGLNYFFCSGQDNKIFFDASGHLGNCGNGTYAIFNNVMYKRDVNGKSECPCDTNKTILRECKEYGIWEDILKMEPDQCD
jgi:hypothetical protein